MTEAEILAVRNDATAIVVSVASFSFAMISAYVAALWLFLKDAPFVLRSLAFLLLSCGLAFMGAMTTGLNGLLLATETAWSKLQNPATGLPGFGNASPAYLFGYTMYEAAALLGFTAFAAIYFALFFLTFFYRWERDPRRLFR